MLCYFQCNKCGQVSDLFLKHEVEGRNPSCNICAETGGSQVEVKYTFAFAIGCRGCGKTWRWCTPSDYSTAKASRPDCPQCKSNAKIYFVPPKLTEEKSKKRKLAGVLDNPKHDPSLYDKVDVEKSLVNAKKTKREAPSQKVEEFIFTPVDEPSFTLLSNMEGDYRVQQKRRKDFTKRFGQLKKQNDPRKTSELTIGRVVTKDDYEENFDDKYLVNVKGTQYPRMNKSAPTVVNDVRILPRSLKWDYRELGPNSFLRRLCAILYMINFGVDNRDAYDEDTQEYKKAVKEYERERNKLNPIELQAMWAGGSLYLSSNNNKYSDELLKALKKKKSVQALVKAVDLGNGGTYGTHPRNFDNDYVNKVKEYQQSIVTNTETSYRSYFLFQWTYVFKQLRDAIEATDIGSVTIERNGDYYDKWTIQTSDKALKAGRVFVVLPETGPVRQGYFKYKEVHAEELFYPILMELDKKGRLTEKSPAFIGGVKTACFTCSIVLDKASAKLKTKLILPTDAYGHYWENSGKHVPALTFKPGTKTIVFSDSKRSDNVFDTEMPLSPRSPEHK